MAQRHCYDPHMGLVERLVKRLSRRPPAEPDEPSQETPRLAPLKPTPGTRPLERPPETAGTRPLEAHEPTAGTRLHRAPGGTPSTARIHNPRRPGR